MLAVIAIIGMSGGLFVQADDLARWRAMLGEGQLAFSLAVVVFVLASFVGVPQVLLVAAAAVAFGPWGGFAISWIGKLVACAGGFWAGRTFGAKLLARYSGPKLERAMAQLSKGGLVACAVIRLFPTVPSVVVNIGAGASPIRWRDFIIGSALGNIPKTALIAFAGDAALKGLAGHTAYLWIAGLAILAAWALLAWVGKKVMAPKG